MKFNKMWLIIPAVAIAIIILMVVVVNSFASRAIGMEEKVTEAYSTIKVQEKRRADLLPNLADAIKAYDEHEYKTLMDVIAARREADGSITDAAVNEINSMVKVVLENYPEIKSQENYKQFMQESSITENKIATAREAYNLAVSRYNTYVRSPINKFFLSLSGYEVVEFSKLDYAVSEDAPTNLFD